MQPSKQRTETGPSRLTDQPRRQHAPPRGFTLVEVLTVIVIIGILAALLVPAVMGAISRAKSAAMRMEVDGLSQAVEAYNLKYGDYPPDFSDWNLVLRHYKKIFPDIQTDELARLGNNSRFGAAIDPAEALVWALGGFSSDSERPFTGTGGPWSSDVNPYSEDRSNSLFDFPASISDASASADRDIFPEYRLDGDQSPFVYFDSRTYLAVRPNLLSSNEIARDLNGYNGGASQEDNIDGIRPLLMPLTFIESATPQWNVTLNSSRRVQFVNAKTFQILAPGIDGTYATHFRNSPYSPNVTEATCHYFCYSTGSMVSIPVNLDTGAIPENGGDPELINGIVSNGYQESSYGPISGNIADNFMLDNVSNFSVSTFGDDITPVDAP